MSPPRASRRLAAASRRRATIGRRWRAKGCAAPERHAAGAGNNRTAAGGVRAGSGGTGRPPASLSPTQPNPAQPAPRPRSRPAAPAPPWRTRKVGLTAQAPRRGLLREARGTPPPPPPSLPTPVTAAGLRGARTGPAGLPQTPSPAASPRPRAARGRPVARHVEAAATPPGAGGESCPDPGPFPPPFRRLMAPEGGSLSFPSRGRWAGVGGEGLRNVVCRRRPPPPTGGVQAAACLLQTKRCHRPHSHVPWVPSQRSCCARLVSVAEEASSRWCERMKAAEGALENWIWGTRSSRLHLDRSI